MSGLIARCQVHYPGFILKAELDLPLDGITVVFGPSGSGKSTLLQSISGLNRHCRGFISLNGEVWQDDAANVFLPPHRRSVGYVFQDARLFPHLTVRGNLLYGARRTPPAERRLDFDKVVESLNLSPLLERSTTSLSGGERQRVAIGRALLASPRLLLMDEPLVSLDEAARENILPLIEQLPTDFQMPLIYVSHSIDEVLRLASTLILINAGQIVAAGPLEEITSRLDLLPWTARLDAGSILQTTVKGHDAAYGITRLAFAGGELMTPLLNLPPGKEVRVRIRSRDVALSLVPPQQSSILNVLEGRVIEISGEAGPQAHVLLDVGSRLWARIMKKSVDDLQLVPGKKVYALIKAVAVDRESLGRPTAMENALADFKDKQG